MVKDIFGNEHDAFKITSDRYNRIVIIEDTKTGQASVVHRSDLDLPINDAGHVNAPNKFDLKATQELHYTQSDLLEKGADNTKFKGQH